MYQYLESLQAISHKREIGSVEPDKTLQSARLIRVYTECIQYSNRVIIKSYQTHPLLEMDQSKKLR